MPLTGAGGIPRAIASFNLALNSRYASLGLSWLSVKLTGITKLAESVQ